MAEGRPEVASRADHLGLGEALLILRVEGPVRVDSGAIKRRATARVTIPGWDRIMLVNSSFEIKVED
jgi:hypothetical protein